MNEYPEEYNGLKARISTQEAEQLVQLAFDRMAAALKVPKSFYQANNMKEYPKDYNGPKAGKSIQEEWIAVRDYDAFKYIRDGVWSYSDFDCWFYSCIEHHRADALKQFQKIQDNS